MKNLFLAATLRDVMWKGAHNNTTTLKVTDEIAAWLCMSRTLGKCWRALVLMFCNALMFNVVWWENRPKKKEQLSGEKT